MTTSYTQYEIEDLAREYATSAGIDPEAFVAAIRAGRIRVDPADPATSLMEAAERMAAQGGAPATPTAAPASTVTAPPVSAPAPAGGGVDQTPRTIPPGNPQPGQMYRHDFGGGVTQWLRFDGERWQPVGERMGGNAPAAPAIPPAAPPATGGVTAEAPEVAAAAPPGGEMEQIARDAARAAGIDEDMFVRQIGIGESGWINHSLRVVMDERTGKPLLTPDGRQVRVGGVAQISPEYHPGVDVMNPVKALNYAAKIMANYLKEYGGDIRKALVRYNGGTGAVQAYEAGKPYRESQLYLDRITGTGGVPRTPSGPATRGAERAASALGALTSTPANEDEPPTPEDDRLASRPFAGLTPRDMTQAEGRYYFPWEDPSRGGTSQAAYNIMTGMGVNPDSGNPYAAFMEDLVDPLYQTVSTLRGLDNRALSPTASGNAEVAGEVGDLLRRGRTTAIDDLPGTLRRLVELGRTTADPNADNTGPLAALAAKLASGGGTGAAGLLNNLIMPNLDPFLRPYLGTALGSRLRRYRNEAAGQPGLSPIEFLARGWA